MDSSRIIHRIIRAAAFLAMFAFSVRAAVLKIWWMYLAELPLMLLFLKLTPSLRCMENRVMFYLVSVLYLPMNLRAVILLWYTPEENIVWLALDIGLMILTLAAMFSAEQIAAGFITRLIWPRQYRSGGSD